MGFIEKWYEDLMARSPSKLKREVEAWGEYYRQAAVIRYAKVKICLGPGESLQVFDDLDKDKSDQLRRMGGFEQIVFGVLDVMLTSPSSPCRFFTLRILDVDINEITSVPIAFRLAARDATQRILKEWAMF
jgi:hypothetical protein